MTREEMQARLEVCRELYTDVRLLDADTVSSIHEGTRTDPSGPDICFACRNKSAFSRHCAAKLALATKSKACRLESCGTDIAHITAGPMSSSSSSAPPGAPPSTRRTAKH